MRKKIVILFAGYLFTILMGLLSCVPKCGPFPDKFKLNKIDWYVCRSVYYDTANINYKLEHFSIIDSSVIYNEYSVLMTMTPETYYSTIQRTNSISLYNSVYACSPIDPTTDEKIDSISIYCDKDFDTEHPTGKNIADLFDVVVVDEVNNIYNQKFTLKDYLDPKPFVPSQMTLILKSPPDKTSEFEFTIKYYQDGIDYDYFEYKTNKIVIKKE